MAASLDPGNHSGKALQEVPAVPGDVERSLAAKHQRSRLGKNEEVRWPARKEAVQALPRWKCIDIIV